MRKPSRSAPASPKARGKKVTPRRLAASSPAKWQLFERKLTQIRDALLSHNHNLLQEAREPIGTSGSHVAETGTDEFDRNQSLRIAASEQGVLHEIAEALERIKRGTYGICEISGKRIPLARLRVVPWTRYTAAVEAERERGKGFRGLKPGMPAQPPAPPEKTRKSRA